MSIGDDDGGEDSDDGGGGDDSNTVKYLVSAHYHVSAHPPLLD